MLGYTKHNRITYRMPERSGGYGGAGMFTGEGLVQGTRVAASGGWTAVETLRPGDLITTFDNGSQMLLEVCHTKLLADARELPETMLPVFVPSGALGNRTDICVPPQQGLLVETHTDRKTNAFETAVMPAAALVGYQGITRERRLIEIDVYTLVFVGPQVVFAEGGLLVSCPQGRGAMAVPSEALSQHGHEVLSHDEAAFIIDLMGEREDEPTPIPPGASALRSAA